MQRLCVNPKIKLIPFLHSGEMHLQYLVMHNFMQFSKKKEQLNQDR